MRSVGEATGPGTSGTATAEAAPTASHEFGPSGPTDAEIMQIMREKQGKGQETQEKADHKQRNIELLVEKYGSQQFKYGVHEGTIHQMIDLCPPIGLLLHKEDGFEKIIDLIDDCKVEAEVEEEEPETVEEQPEETLEKETTKEGDKQQEKATDLVDATKSETTPKDAAAESTDSTDSTDTADSTKSVDAQTDVQVSDTDATGTSEVQLTANDAEKAGDVPIVAAAVAAAPTKAATVDTISAKVQPVTAEVAHEKASAEVESVSELAPEAKIETVSESEAKSESSKLVEPTDSELSDGTDETDTFDLIESVLENEIEANEDELDESDVELSELSDLSELPDPNDEQLPDAIETEIQPDDEPIVIPHSELLEAWRQLGEDDAPIEITLSTITEQLAEIQANDEQELSIDHPEQQRVLLHIDAAREALSRVYTSRTKEECATHIDELTNELVQLLRMLGYQHPEAAIEQYMKGNNLESLDELLRYFEAALRKSIERELKTKQQKHVSRHSALGQLAMRIIQAFKPEYGVATN